FGVLLFEMLTGMKPFSGGDMSAILEKIVRMPIPSVAAINTEVSPELDTVIQRLTAKAPEQRFASAAETLEAIERLRARLSSARPAESEPTQRLTGEKRATLSRRPVPSLLFVLAVLVAIALVAIPSVM